MFALAAAAIVRGDVLQRLPVQLVVERRVPSSRCIWYCRRRAGAAVGGVSRHETAVVQHPIREREQQPRYVSVTKMGPLNFASAAAAVAAPMSRVRVYAKKTMLLLTTMVITVARVTSAAAAAVVVVHQQHKGQ